MLTKSQKIGFYLAVILLFFSAKVFAVSLPKGGEYRSLTSDILRIISSEELELEDNTGIISASYTIDGNKIRVTYTALGTKMVKYFEIIEAGLRDIKQGEIFYSKNAILKLNEERKAAAKRAEEERKAAIEIIKKNLVLVKGGTFQMGDTFGDGLPEEKPVHEVTLADFYIDKYEVTQKEYQTVMGENPSIFKNCDKCPVETVTWDNAKNFCEKVGKRLPTEAEWEYAARSGGKQEKYAGTNENIGDYAWYVANSGDTTHPVGQKKPNGLEIYDMSGNVWEWCSDWYAENYYSNSPKDNPQGSTSGQYKVLRGGSWYPNGNARGALTATGAFLLTGTTTAGSVVPEQNSYPFFFYPFTLF